MKTLVTTVKFNPLRRVWFSILSFIYFAINRPRLTLFIPKMSSVNMLEISSGSYGTYYQSLKNPKMGIKVIKSFKNAQEEFKNLQKAYNICPDLFPKPGKIIYVKELSRYGYTMEHISYPTLYKCKSINDYIVTEQIEMILEEFGIIHMDLHKSNILYDINTGNFKVIDTDPTFFIFKEVEGAI